MPFVTHRGQRIHYTLEGSGPLVVLQHGLFVDGQSWATAGFVEVLAERYRVACVDSLGHGRSDKPADPALYAQAQRAGDIVAVMDHLGVEHGHLVGHSMGAWISIGVAKYYPGRLASLTLGGWDPARGVAAALPTSLGDPIPFDLILGGARLTGQTLVDWVTPEAEPGLRACWDALDDVAGAEAAVRAASCPVLLWCGLGDPYHKSMQSLAAAHGLRFLSTPGDHMGAVMVHGVESATGVLDFIDQSAIADDRPRWSTKGSKSRSL